MNPTYVLGLNAYHGDAAAARQMRAVSEWILGRGDRPSCMHFG